MEIARIEYVKLREVWNNEAYDFTPWLLVNADVLSEALGIELELEAAEHAVGGFSLDIIGRDLTHDCALIVENQIEGTDHSHLGQLLTYAGGVAGGGTIAWIAGSFREEHRQALDWLNEHTGEEVRFFGTHSGRSGSPALLLRRSSRWSQSPTTGKNACGRRRAGRSASARSPSSSSGLR